MRKLKEREAGINQCLKGRMKVRVITKVINNRTLEGYVLEVEDEDVYKRQLPESAKCTTLTKLSELFFAYLNNAFF